MKRTISNLLFLFLLGTVFAQPATGNASKFPRECLSLNKGWRFYKGDVPFPVIKGQGMTYDNAKAGTSWGAAAPGYDDADWRIVNLPHDWVVENPVDPNENIAQGYRARGYGWYRRTFKLAQEDLGKHIELQKQCAELLQNLE